MTVDQIFDRYEVSEAERESAYQRVGWLFAVRDAWAGPLVDWVLLSKAVVFYRLGDDSHSAHIRKKVGLDKYAATLIVRTASQHVAHALTDNDLHQIMLLYVLGRADLAVERRCGESWAMIAARVEDSCLAAPEQPCARQKVLDALSRMEVYHYKNPSV